MTPPKPHNLQAAQQVINQTVAMVNQQQETIQALQGDREMLHSDYAKLQDDHEQLKRQVAYLTRQMFGRKSERFDLDDSPGLFDVDGPDAPQLDVDAQQETVPHKKPKARGKRPNLAQADLPQEVVVIEPEGIDASTHKRIGEEVSYSLEYEPGKLYKIKTVRPKYALHTGEGPILIAQVPSMPMPKGIAGPGLCAAVVLNKFADHRVQGEAVDEMRVGLSEPGDRARPQTIPNRGGQEPLWEASGRKGAT